MPFLMEPCNFFLLPTGLHGRLPADCAADTRTAPRQHGRGRRLLYQRFCHHRVWLPRRLHVQVLAAQCARRRNDSVHRHVAPLVSERVCVFVFLLVVVFLRGLVGHLPSLPIERRSAGAIRRAANHGDTDRLVRRHFVSKHVMCDCLFRCWPLLLAIASSAVSHSSRLSRRCFNVFAALFCDNFIMWHDHKHTKTEKERSTQTSFDFLWHEHHPDAKEPSTARHGSL